MDWLQFILILVLLFGALIFVVQAMRKQALQTKKELQTLRYELNTKTSQTALQLYQQLPGKERIVYDSRDHLSTITLTGAGAQTWNYVEHRFDPEPGSGRHEIMGSEIVLQRTNTAGRYELHIHRYNIGNQEYSEVPADPAKGIRNLRLRCEVKKETASHLLRFVFKGIESKEVLDEKDYVVFNPDWEPVELVLAIASQEPCTLRIDDLLIMQAPSQIRIRNLALYEKS